MNFPSWWEFLLLALAAFRVWKLLADDVIFDRPRSWVIVKAQKRGGNARALYVDAFLTCPWCCGFWVSLAIWGLWEAWARATLIACVPLAISAVVGVIAHHTAEDD